MRYVLIFTFSRRCRLFTQSINQNGHEIMALMRLKDENSLTKVPDGQNSRINPCNDHKPETRDIISNPIVV